MGRVTERIPDAVRELLLALAQVAAVIVPAVVAIVLAAQQRWRRLALVAAAGVAGAAVFVLADTRLELAGGVPEAVSGGTWLASPDFPSLPYIAGLSAAAMVGKPWMSRPWRRATDLAVIALVAVVAIAGTLGVPELLLAAALGSAVGAAVLTVVRCAEPPAVPGGGRRRPAGSRPRRRRPDPRAGRRRAIAALHGCHGRRRARLRQGVRARQPRRRCPVPRVPEAAPAWPERIVAVGLAAG